MTLFSWKIMHVNRLLFIVDILNVRARNLKIKENVSMNIN